jgi:RNA-directed DNA polymerase
MAELQKRLLFIRKRFEPYLKSIDEYVESENQSAYYEILKRRKRNGGYRYLYSCTNSDLRSAHKVLYEILRDYQQYLHPSAHGFIKGKSTFTNAQPHTQQNFILHLDIKNFFDSITIAQVKAAFLDLGASQEVSALLSKLTTVDGVLRQGLHTSPDISNHCLREIDTSLGAYSANNHLVCTRYGDDMTFSGEQEPVAKELISIIEEVGFTVNKAKIKLQKRGSNQYVTGLTVFDEKPRIPRGFKKRLRLKMYYINKYGFENHIERTRSKGREYFGSDEDYQHYLEGLFHGGANYIVGHVGYLNSVERLRAQPMWNMLNDQNIRDYR